MYTCRQEVWGIHLVRRRGPRLVAAAVWDASPRQQCVQGTWRVWVGPLLLHVQLSNPFEAWHPPPAAVCVCAVTGVVCLCKPQGALLQYLQHLLLHCSGYQVAVRWPCTFCAARAAAGEDKGRTVQRAGQAMVLWVGFGLALSVFEPV
jgi:hypothetical protein